MTEPKRWIDEGPPEAIERLLSAASAEKPPEAGMARTLGVLGVGLGTAGAASTATASTAGASAAGGALGAASVGKASGVFAAGTVAKWGLVMTVVAASGVAAKVATTHYASALTAQAAAQVQTPVPGPTTPLASKPVAAPPGPEIVPLSPLAASVGAVAVEAPGVTRPSLASNLPKAALKGGSTLPSAPEAPIDVERLNEEVALVDQARGALARGDARAAISALDDYDARFSARRFVPEALYLRMESLLRLNQSAAARAVASRLATSYPSSPHAARARQVLGGSIP